MRSRELRIFSIVSLAETFILLIAMSNKLIEGDIPYYLLIVSTGVSLFLWIATLAALRRERKEQIDEDLEKSEEDN